MPVIDTFTMRVCMIMTFDAVIMVAGVDGPVCVGIPPKPASNADNQHKRNQNQIPGIQNRYRNLKKQCLEISNNFATTHRQESAVDVDADIFVNRVNRSIHVGKLSQPCMGS